MEQEVCRVPRRSVVLHHVPCRAVCGAVRGIRYMCLFVCLSALPDCVCVFAQWYTYERFHADQKKKSMLDSHSQNNFDVDTSFQHICVSSVVLLFMLWRVCVCVCSVVVCLRVHTVWEERGRVCVCGVGGWWFVCRCWLLLVGGVVWCGVCVWCGCLCVRTKISCGQKGKSLLDSHVLYH